MNKVIFFRLALLVLVFLSANSHADDKPLKELKAFLNASKSLSADFKQELVNEAGTPVQTSYGVFYLQRPGKFRWNYKKPFQQEIVATDGKVSFYDVDLEQVTVKKIDESLGSTPALLLSGEISLENNFNIDKQGEEANIQWIKLTPKNQESTFKYVLIGLVKGNLARMALSDNFGQVTHITFSNVLLNPPLKPTLFDFKAPKGVDVFSD